MKQKYFSLILFLCGFVLQAQTTTLTYNNSGAGGAEDSSTFNVILNNLTTCQNSVILNVDGYGYNPNLYAVKYKVSFIPSGFVFGEISKPSSSTSFK